jgi:hypothetical protein
LAGYPASYALISDTSSSWTVSIVDPCVTSTLAGLDPYSAMTTSVMFGSAVTQPFTEPSDSISTTFDTTLTHYIYNIAGFYTGPFPGSNICGARSYSISSACSGFLTVTFPVDPNKPVLSVISSSAGDVGTNICTVTSGLSLYSQTVT